MSDEQCCSLIEETMRWYQAQAQGRERLGTVFVRLGLDKYLDEVVKPLGLEVIENPEERRKFYAEGNMYT